MCNDRDDKGRFVKGHSKRFAEGNDAASKYKDEYCERMLAWFISEEHPFPQFTFFAEELGVGERTLLNWCTEHPRFADYYARCKQIQLAKINEGTMFRQFDPSFAKFLAINCHGMKEKVEQDVKADATITVKITEVD
jgi:hypothetical protein